MQDLESLISKEKSYISIFFIFHNKNKNISAISFYKLFLSMIKTKIIDIIKINQLPFRHSFVFFSTIYK